MQNPLLILFPRWVQWKQEETDESLFWMELLIEAGIVESGKLESLMKEADEILAITVASINTAKRNR